MSATVGKASMLALLRDAYPRHTAKLAARAAEAPLATAKAWAAGRFVPSADTLLRMAERDDAIADALERLLHERRAARGQDRVVAPAGAGVAMASPGKRSVTGHDR